MKLLVVTQTLDTNDPVLGFFHRWITEFASHMESIEVICLNEGVHSLPNNVRVHTLGKRQGGHRLLYVLRFWWLVVKLRRSYDTVLVHMNPEYILLAADFWLMSGKKIALWYNHEVGSWALKLAAPVCSKIFHTSPYAYTARYAQAVKMPAGIDTSVFVPRDTLIPSRSVYMQGRVAPAKNVHVLLAALRILRERQEHARATIVGPIDHTYGLKLHTEYDDLLDGDGVTMKGPVRNEETPALYAAHQVSVNLAADGNYDKTVLESLACGTPAIVSSRAFADIIPGEWRIPYQDPQALAEALSRFFALSEEERTTLARSLSEKVRTSHSLRALGERLKSELALCYGGATNKA